MSSSYNKNIVQKKINIEVNILCEIQFSPPYLNFMHMGGLCESMSVNHVHAVFESEARQRCWIWISYDTESVKPHMGSGN